MTTAPVYRLVYEHNALIKGLGWLDWPKTSITKLHNGILELLTIDPLPKDSMITCTTFSTKAHRFHMQGHLVKTQYLQCVKQLVLNKSRQNEKPADQT